MLKPTRSRRLFMVPSGASVGPPSAPPRPAWRTDIEGLRGVAVLLVVLYHAGFPGFSGGYIGVDVFFVLSGYLITGILAGEAETTGTIDLPRFYARRVRRLLPAVTLLLVGVSAFAFVFYGPLEQLDLAKTAIATAAYLSNVFFGRRATDYLAAEAEANPLLHTWSLAVEEQFYLVWPALVVLLLVGPLTFFRNRRGTAHVALHRRRLIGGTAVLAVGSFAFMLVLMNTGRTHWAFFSSPARGWEFALGSLGVLIPRTQPPRAWTLAGLSFDGITDRVPPPAQAAGWGGLAAIVASGVVFTAQTPFPGWAAVLPVVGTVFVLRAGSADATTALTEALSWRPLRELGRLSYSWYLWHWPVLVFASALYGELSLATRLLLLVVSLGLAELSYRLVENPVRHSRALSRRPAYGIALLGILTACSLGLAASWWMLSQAQLQNPGQARYAAAQADIPDLYARNCHDTFLSTRPAACSDGPDDASFTVALYGDSHAAQWAPAFQKIASERGWRIVYLTKASCPGIAATVYHETLGRAYTECDAWRAAALDTLRSMRPDLVVMSSDSDYALSPAAWTAGSERVFGALSGIANAVLVIRDTPNPRTDVLLCLSRRAWHRTMGLPSAVTPPSCDFLAADPAQAAVYDAQRRAAAPYANVHVVDWTELLCPAGTCDVETQDYVMYRDSHHLSAHFVSSLAHAIERRIRSILPDHPR